jgi:hypothetical protein
MPCPGYDPQRSCPVECQSQLVLEEVRRLNEKFDEFLQRDADDNKEIAERVAVLENDVKRGIRGNGTPSIQAQHEERLTALEKAWWKIIGACSAVAFIITLALHIIPWGK